MNESGRVVFPSVSFRVFRVFRGWPVSRSICHTSPRLRPACVFFVYFVVASLSHAQSVPPYVSYQGRVTTSDGAAFTEVTNLTFSIFSTNAGGVAVWGPREFPVHVVDGYFNVVLGEDDEGLPVTDAFTNAATWVEVVCDSHTNTPRQKIVSVPYAVRAQSVPHFAARDETVLVGSNYLAGTDGFVCVYGSRSYAAIDVSSDSTFTTNDQIAVLTSEATGSHHASVTIPVRRGEYWRVRHEGGNAPQRVYWMPLHY
jgi:hypothetical protein